MIIAMNTNVDQNGWTTVLIVIPLTNVFYWQLLCSMSAAGSRALWEDVTQSTPLSIAGVHSYHHHHHHHHHHSCQEHHIHCKW